MRIFLVVFCVTIGSPHLPKDRGFLVLLLFFPSPPPTFFLFQSSVCFFCLHYRTSFFFIICTNTLPQAHPFLLPPFPPPTCSRFFFCTDTRPIGVVWVCRPVASTLGLIWGTPHGWSPPTVGLPKRHPTRPGTLFSPTYPTVPTQTSDCRGNF